MSPILMAVKGLMPRASGRHRDDRVFHLSDGGGAISRDDDNNSITVSGGTIYLDDGGALTFAEKDFDLTLGGQMRNRFISITSLSKGTGNDRTATVNNRRQIIIFARGRPRSCLIILWIGIKMVGVLCPRYDNHQVANGHLLTNPTDGVHFKV